MNKESRKKVKEIFNLIEKANRTIVEAINEIEEVQSDEQEVYGNLPEVIQKSEISETMKEAIDKLNDAINEIMFNYILEDLENVDE